MITDSFDNSTPAIIERRRKENAPKVDACIITFSHEIEAFVRDNFASGEIASLFCATGRTPVYLIERNGKRTAFYRTYVGAPITVALIEDAIAELDCRKFVLFGGAGCLNKEIARGKVMVPTEAYRDEGTSYHYAPASDYVKVKNWRTVETFMKENGLPFVTGKTWTTDAFYRETQAEIRLRRQEGCIAVEMELAACQAVCNDAGIELFSFLYRADNLDAASWERGQRDSGLSKDARLQILRVAYEIARRV